MSSRQAAGSRLRGCALRMAFMGRSAQLPCCSCPSSSFNLWLQWHMSLDPTALDHFALAIIPSLLRRMSKRRLVAGLSWNFRSRHLLLSLWSHHQPVFYLQRTDADATEVRGTDLGVTSSPEFDGRHSRSRRAGFDLGLDLFRGLPAGSGPSRLDAARVCGWLRILLSCAPSLRRGCS